MASKFPAEYFSPYAPVIVEQDTTELKVVLPDLTELTLSRDLRNGKATFDVSEIFRTLFENRQEPESIAEAPNLVFETDYLLVTSGVILNGIGPYQALRVVPIRGRENDASVWSYPDILLPQFTSSEKIALKVYEGFPLWLGLRVKSDNDVFFVATLGDGSEEVFALRLSSTILIDCTDLKSLERQDLLKIDFIEGCVPDDPTYVRWVNSMGGWSYWMFDGSRGLGRKTEKGDTFQLAGAKDLDAVETTGELEPTVTEYINCGAEQLDRTDYFALREIASSPLVQIYDVSRSLFTRVIVGSTDFVWDTQTSRGKIDLELTLMSSYTQF